MDSQLSTAANVSRPELMRELDRFAQTQLAVLLPVEKTWQPSDFLPNLSSEQWLDELTAFRQAASGIPDDVLITLVANMITEEALPAYHSWLANLESGFDRSGVGTGGIAQWMRGWVAEEKRHGDVLTRYLYATGRVDMRAIEKTIHHLLRNGFDPLTENSIIEGFIYTSFQERATYVSHSRTGLRARENGDKNLGRICDYVAGEEIRHERVYQRCIAHLFTSIPDACMVALAAMLRKTIIMPSRRMTDGVDPDLFTIFSAITQRNGIYTTSDYAAIMDYLVRMWKVADQPVTTPEGRAARDFVCELPARYRKLAPRAEARLAACKPRPMSWIFNRSV